MEYKNEGNRNIFANIVYFQHNNHADKRYCQDNGKDKKNRCKNIT